ncbi:hypothetical protein BH09VER1_BH09VER1_12950 [soil metagenome]
MKQFSRIFSVRLRNLSLGFLVYSAAASSLHASTFTWANVGTDFTTGTNWLGGAAPANTGTAVFNIAASTSPNLAVSNTLNAIQINTATASGYTFSSSNGATFTILSTGTTASTSALYSAISSGANVFNSSIIFGAAADSVQAIYQISGGTLVFNGVLGSTNSINLRLANNGVYVFNGANTYSGTTNQALNGTLVLGNKSALGSSTLVLGASAGALQAGTDLTGANKLTNSVVLAGAAETILNGAAVDFGGSVDLSGTTHNITNNNLAGTTFSGVISNDGGYGLVFTGSGVTTLSGQNTYSGVNSIYGAGKVSVSTLGVTGSASNLGTSGTVNLGSSNTAGNLRYTGAGETSDKVINLSGLASGGSIDTTGATGGLVLSGGVISGTGVKSLTLTGNTGSNAITGNIANPAAGAVSVIKDGTGSWTLSGSNSYTGNTSLLNGTLNLDFNGAAAPSSNIISTSSTLSLNAGTASSATLNIIGKANAASSQAFASGATAIGAGAFHVNLFTSGSGTISTTLGSIATGRTAGFTLDVTMPTGATVVTSSTTVATGAVGNMVTVNGADFATVNSGTLAAFTAYTANTGTTLSTAQSQIVDMSSGDTALTGSALVTVSGLRFNSAAARTITLDPAKLLAVGGGQASGGLLVTSTVGANLSKITGGLLAGISSRDLVILQNNTAGDLQIDSTITSLNANNLALTKSGAGKLILTGSNTFGGAANYLNEGTTVVTADATVGNTQVLTTGSGSAVLTGVDTTGLFIGQRVMSTNVTGSTTQGAFISAIGAGTITMSLSATASGSGNVTFGNSGGLGTQSGAGAVQIGSAATLQIGNGGATGGLVAAQGITNSGTVAINHTNAFTFSNTVSGVGAFVHAGTGTTTVTSVNDYTGSTLVNAGTLLLDGSAINSAANVNSGGALGGSGSVGSITVNAGGAITPGSGGIGAFSTNNGNLTWNGQASGTFGQMKFELGTGNTSDLIALGTGMLDKNTGSVFSFDFQGTGAVGNTYTLITFGTTDFVVSDFSYTGLGSGLTGSFVENAGNLQFVTSAVPEPCVVGLAGLGLAFVIWRGRRHSTPQ